MGSKQNLQLLSLLSETLEKYRQNRYFYPLLLFYWNLTLLFPNRDDTIAAVSTLRSHLSAMASCHNLNANDTSKRTQQSSPQHSESYTELLLSKYRENCSKLQQDLLDTKAKLTASESYVKDLQVQSVEFLFLTAFEIFVWFALFHRITCY